MDFGTLPPEITAALIHSGPGAGSWIEASGVWQQLAIELEDSLPGYGSVLSSLTDAWSGPSSAAMVQAVEPYLSWVRTTAQQCGQVAASAAAAAAAFNSAVATVVHPTYVSANRVRLAKLLATNWFGTNLGAIAATEDEYGAMWANNSAAMYRYQAASAQVFELSQFSLPPAIVNPAAAAAQAGAVPTAAASTPAASLLQSIFAPNTNATGTGLAGLLNLFSGSAQSSFGSLLNSNILNPAILTSTVPGSGFPINLLSYLAQSSSAQSLQSVGGELGQGLSQGASALGATANDMAGAVRGVGSAPTAAVGVGVSLGKLTAPPATVGLLTASQAPVQLASAASPLAAGEPGFPFMPPPMMPPVAPRKGKGKGKGDGKGEGRDYDDIEIGLEIKGTFMTRPPSAG
jgi:PPE-repeat protein